ncbi:SDR family oxidoreductase [Sphingobium nicotianae]|uniref:SDR family oxidoreductase n=1 Tax=Sphingobium nicotianae TaxID=2782607 RepID=A0A9X1DC13_9SPHN|nr:SDR family oxidoreductase [Sphingobium nicotianae]MBT2187300.1 SDR family oxidoreductase [Sphingobium nicotianae]
MHDLSRHTAVITGASSGIGAAVARAFAAGGAKLVLAARRQDRLEALARELEGEGGELMIRPTDVTSEDDVVGLFAAAEAFSPVTLLVANAGVVSHMPTADCTMAHWNEVIGVNLTAAFLCGREAFRAMKPRGRGRIINIGSLSAQMPRENTIAYTASKYGLEGITRSLALDGRAHGITASIIHPGSTITELMGEQTNTRPPSDKTMEATHVANLIAMMAAVPDEVNLLTATMLPIAQPYLGRG